MNHQNCPALEVPVVEDGATSETAQQMQYPGPRTGPNYLCEILACSW